MDKLERLKEQYEDAKEQGRRQRFWDKRREYLLEQARRYEQENGKRKQEDDCISAPDYRQRKRNPGEVI